MPITYVASGAIIENDYRYLLWRAWNPAGPVVTFIMANPSTADGTINDPTIRRCIGFARDWGFGALVVVNLFAYRATQWRDVLAARDPVGAENDAYLLAAARRSACLVAAWGCLGHYQGRDRAVLELLAHPHIKCACLLCFQARTVSIRKHPK